MKTTPTKTSTVLYAEDDSDDRMIMQEVLDLVGGNHTIVEVPNGEAVLTYLSSVKSLEQYPCLIVLDNNMPRLSGREALVKIRKEPLYNHIPVVILSTTINQQDFSFFHSMGARCYTKPSSFAAFKNMIAEILSFCSEENNKAA